MLGYQSVLQMGLIHSYVITVSLSLLVLTDLIIYIKIVCIERTNAVHFVTSRYRIIPRFSFKKFAFFTDQFFFVLLIMGLWAFQQTILPLLPYGKIIQHSVLIVGVLVGAIASLAPLEQLVGITTPLMPLLKVPLSSGPQGTIMIWEEGGAFKRFYGLILACVKYSLLLVPLNIALSFGILIAFAVIG